MQGCWVFWRENRDTLNFNAIPLFNFILLNYRGPVAQHVRGVAFAPPLHSCAPFALNRWGPVAQYVRGVAYAPPLHSFATSFRNTGPVAQLGRAIGSYVRFFAWQGNLAQNLLNFIALGIEATGTPIGQGFESPQARILLFLQFIFLIIFLWKN